MTVDLKLGKLTFQDLGQMQMYVNFFHRFQRAALAREREAAERALRLAANVKGLGDGEG